MWSQQDMEQEPPVRPPLPQELQESHQVMDQGHGWTESPYEVGNFNVVTKEHNQVWQCFNVFPYLCFRESTATLLILYTDEETASPTSLMWKHREMHPVGTNILIEDREYNRSEINIVCCISIFSVTSIIYIFNECYYAKGKLCSLSLGGFVIPSTLIFLFLPVTLPFQPSCLILSIHFIARISAWFKVDPTRHNQPINQGLILHNFLCAGMQCGLKKMLQI